MSKSNLQSRIAALRADIEGEVTLPDDPEYEEQRIEPVLEIVHLRTFEFTGLPIAEPPKAWQCLSRRRDVPAQPSSRFT